MFHLFSYGVVPFKLVGIEFRIIDGAMTIVAIPASDMPCSRFIAFIDTDTSRRKNGDIQRISVTVAALNM